eukprot:Awhi_evm1s7691
MMWRAVGAVKTSVYKVRELVTLGCPRILYVVSMLTSQRHIKAPFNIGLNCILTSRTKTPRGQLDEEIYRESFHLYWKELGELPLKKYL